MQLAALREKVSLLQAISLLMLPSRGVCSNKFMNDVCILWPVQARDLSVNKLQQFRFVRDPAYAPKDVKEANVLLVSWNVGSSVLFFLDPTAVEIVEWHIDLGVILDLQVRQCWSCLSVYAVYSLPNV